MEELENELHLLRQERDTLSQQVDILKMYVKTVQL